MTNRNDLVGNPGNAITGGFCLADPGRAYVVYLPSGGIKSLNLSGESGTFRVQWFDPRSGGELQDGSVTQLEGGAAVSLGLPPSGNTLDWAVLVMATEADSDDDTIPDVTEGAGDPDHDGLPNYLDPDSDNDLIADYFEMLHGTDFLSPDAPALWIEPVQDVSPGLQFTCWIRDGALLGQDYTLLHSPDMIDWQNAEAGDVVLSPAPPGSPNAGYFRLTYQLGSPTSAAFIRLVRPAS